MFRKNINTLCILIASILCGATGVYALDVGAPMCVPSCESTCTFSFNSTGTSVVVSCTKDLSNVVLYFCDESASYKFDNLNVGHTYTFSYQNKQISKVAAKAGCSTRYKFRTCLPPTPTPTATPVPPTPTPTATPKPTPCTMIICHCACNCSNQAQRLVCLTSNRCETITIRCEDWQDYYIHGDTKGECVNPTPSPTPKPSPKPTPKPTATPSPSPTPCQYDACGICGGDGKKEVILKARTKRMIRKVNSLLNVSILKYLDIGRKCGLNSSDADEIEKKSLKLSDDTITLIKSLQKKVWLCPEECAKGINKTTKKQIRKNVKKLVELARLTRKAVVPACNGENGAWDDYYKRGKDIDKDVNKCPNGICRK